MSAVRPVLSMYARQQVDDDVSYVHIGTNALERIGIGPVDVAPDGYDAKRAMICNTRC